MNIGNSIHNKDNNPIRDWDKFVQLETEESLFEIDIEWDSSPHPFLICEDVRWIVKLKATKLSVLCKERLKQIFRMRKESK